MATRPVLHATFTLERTCPAAPSRVFAAWADPAAKARWFAGAGTTHWISGSTAARRSIGRGLPSSLP